MTRRWARRVPGLRAAALAAGLGSLGAAVTGSAAAPLNPVAEGGPATAASVTSIDPASAGPRPVHGPFALDLQGPAAGPPGAGGAPGGPPVPGTVFDAYRAAADAIAAADPSCGLDWAVLAGIGHVESGHARGGRVDATGRTTSPILGPPLDGRPGVMAIADSDGGRLDGDPVWDRAVGPMQFIPTTWAAYGRDGNGDGVADPHNVRDAAYSAGSYLCAGPSELRTVAGASAALLRYNRSQTYVATVLRLAQGYRTGVVPPAPVPPAAVLAAVPPPAAAPAPALATAEGTADPAAVPAPALPPATLPPATPPPANSTSPTTPAPTTTPPPPTTTTTPPPPTTTTTTLPPTTPAAATTTAPAAAATGEPAPDTTAATAEQPAATAPVCDPATPGDPACTPGAGA